MEKDNERVAHGKLVHEYSYLNKKDKELFVDNLLKIDIIDKKYVHEVKLSSKLSYPAIMQLVYYLYYLNEKGIHKEGIIHYPKEKVTQKIVLNDNYKKEINKALIGIKKITESPTPPKTINSSICKKCAYYEFCFCGEDIWEIIMFLVRVL